MDKRYTYAFPWSLVVLVSLALAGLPSVSQATPEQSRALLSDPITFDGLRWRELGPAVMGGRISDISVVEKDPDIIYVGTASGGVWRTTDGGITFKPVFEHVGPMSIGAIAVCQSDPSLLWVGTGEANNRNTSPWGAGVYKSTDAGESWSFVGLRDTQHIGQIEIDPRNPSVVYVAALGHLWGPNEERGLYKTTDGGKTWVRVLYIDQDTGVVDVRLDPQSPDTVYAATYQRRRTAFWFNGGGHGSALYKSTDGGATWRKLTNGLPYAAGGDTGRIGIAIYRKDPRIIYAEIEHAKGGLYRSVDRGETWTKMSDVNPVPAYFSRFNIDPNNDLRVYVASMQGGRVAAGIDISEDGGKTFKPLGNHVHPDFHAMWIDPSNSKYMIIGVDGGVYVSRNGGDDWEFLNNIPIGQAYQVGYDMGRPYRVCAGYQDNGIMCAATASRNPQGIKNSDWVKAASGDGFHALPDPTDSNAIYTESQEGQVRRFNLITHEWAGIAPRPKEGAPPYRFHWNSPLIVSAHNLSTLYFAAQFLFKSTDRGDTWAAISPDLTTGVDRNTLATMGRLPKDQEIARGFGVPSYPTITRIAESRLDAQVLWVGTDDGNLQVTSDGGKNWRNVADRIPGLAKGFYVSCIEASRLGPGAAYAVIDGHRSNEFGVYVYLTTDFGQTWQSVAGDLPRAGNAAHVIREDMRNPDLLFLGTEFGCYMSLDRGRHWSLLGGALPTVRVDDIQIHPRDHDLILATHGRSVWILDDITALSELSRVANSTVHLFDIRPAISWREFLSLELDGTEVNGSKPFAGQNPPKGALITYYLKQAPKEKVHITIADKSGTAVRQLDGPALAGINRVSWDLRYPDPSDPSGAQGGSIPNGFFDPRFSSIGAPFVEPGDYIVTINIGKEQASASLRIEEDPVITISEADRASRHEAVMRAYDLYRSALEASNKIRALKTSLTSVMNSWSEEKAPKVSDGVVSAARDLIKDVDGISTIWIGTRLTSDKSTPLTYTPPSLAGRLGGALFDLESNTAAPRPRDLEELAELAAIERETEERLKQTLDGLAKLNKAISDSSIPFITIPNK